MTEAIDEVVDERWWEIHWLVPALNAIGGKSYWTLCENGRFNSLEAASAAYERAMDNGDGAYRLSVVTRRSIAACTSKVGSL